MRHSPATTLVAGNPLTISAARLGPLIAASRAGSMFSTSARICVGRARVSNSIPFPQLTCEASAAMQPMNRSAMARRNCVGTHQMISRAPAAALPGSGSNLTVSGIFASGR